MKNTHRRLAIYPCFCRRAFFKASLELCSIIMRESMISSWRRRSLGKYPKKCGLSQSYQLALPDPAVARNF